MELTAMRKEKGSKKEVVTPQKRRKIVCRICPLCYLVVRIEEYDNHLKEKHHR